MKSNERRITVYDIAKEAGVSASTVSRVLTGNGPVNEQKRELVLKILQKHDFRPSAVARSLKARRSHSIGFTNEEASCLCRCITALERRIFCIHGMREIDASNIMRMRA